MKPLEPIKDLVPYLLQIKEALTKLQTLARARNKTVKMKAAIATFDVMLSRVNAALNIAKMGNNEDISVSDPIVLRELYNPVIEYWMNELLEKV